LIAVLANIPIANAPTIPATPCTELTSSASSIFNFSLNSTTPEYEITPIAIPITNACSTLTNPDAGVIPARPAIAPLIVATTEGFPVLIHERPA